MVIVCVARAVVPAEVTVTVAVTEPVGRTERGRSNPLQVDELTSAWMPDSLVSVRDPEARVRVHVPSPITLSMRTLTWS